MTQKVEGKKYNTNYESERLEIQANYEICKYLPQKTSYPTTDKQ